MIKAGSITKGTFLKWRGDPVMVTDKEFFNPGKGSAVVRVKFKNLKTGNAVREVFRTDDGVEDINVQLKKSQFLYKSGDQYVFMNNRTYEQIEVDEKAVGDSKQFIKEGEEYGLSIWQEEVIAILLPKRIVFEIAKTEQAIKGDTVTGATKPATLDNGAVIQVPLFIKKAEKVIVSTETGEYIGRKN